MKWVCLMANMVIPGVGTLFIKRWGAGLIQTVLSLIAWGMFIPGLMIGWRIWKTLEEVRDQALAEEFDSLSSQSQKMSDLVMGNIPLLVLGIVGVILLKITLIWSGITVVRHFKALNEAEAQETAAASVEVPPPLDSSN